MGGGNSFGGGGMGGGMSGGMSGMGMTSSSSSLDRWGGGGGASISMGAGSSMGGAMGAGVVGGRRSDAIVIRNLAMDTTWQMLKDRFNHVGDIKYAEMKDRGVGVIRYTNTVSSVK